MSGIAKSAIHAVIAKALDGSLLSEGDRSKVPFRLSVASIGDLAIYAFTLTSPPGGRAIDECKIQLIAPGQARGERGHLAFAPGAFTLLMGWSQDDDVFVLWDAYAHSSFAYSQNLQVKMAAICEAQVIGISTVERRLRDGKGVETVLAARSDCLYRGIRLRLDFTAQRLAKLGEPHG